MLSTEDQLVSKHLPLVRRLAWQMVGRLPANIELDDLMQAGLMGLLDAIRRYEKQPDAQFETYATMRIRGAMLDELRSQDWLPRSVRSKARTIEETIARLNHQLMRPPTEAEIAADMALPIDDYHALLEEAHGVQVLHYEDFGRMQDDEAGHPLDYLNMDTDGHSRAEPFGRVVVSDLRQSLVQAIKQLPEREQLLLSLQFQQGLTQKEIAAVLEVSEGRVSQIRSQAVVRLRAALHESGWQDKPGEASYQELL
ncbi:MAG TPA: RNA polymerase sigma factor FliA [Burkholderiaceae bacterium]|nr:RNA polymerase sigma factor FliA [Burkholderiaceae bacterium]